MKKLYFIIILVIPFFVFAKPLTLDDINKVMDTMFDYHIEFNEYNEKLVNRSFKIYIDQFDSLKIYLLDSEISQFADLSKKDTKKILEKVKNNDFNDYIGLSQIFQKAVIRAQKNREIINKALIINNFEDNKYAKIKDYNNFAKDPDELMERQKAIILNFYLNQKKNSVIDTQAKQRKLFNLLEGKFSKIESQYLDSNNDVLAHNIAKSVIRGMDAHSYLFSEEEAEQIRLSLEKEFEGVGLVLSESIDGVMITDIIKNSPAHKSGVIKVDDVLVEINGKSIEHLEFDKVMKMMKGKDSPYLLLGFKRNIGNKNFSFWRVKLERKPIAVDDQRLTYTYEPFANGIIGKLDLKSFYENSNGITSEKDIKTAIMNLRKTANLKGIILDLRENAGGFLSQAIKITSLFMKNGVIVISKNSKQEIRYLRSLEKDAYYNGPLIILTSRLSASASEIVAQALQDYGIALIVGDERTFGKGSIQYQTITDKNADYYFKVTVGKYYTVSGKTTQIEGVKADIVVPSRFSAFKIGEKYLQYPLESDTVKEAYKDSLSDIDGRVKIWFKQNYLPYMQRKVVYWTNMVSKLQKNSQDRMSKNMDFQKFLKRIEQVKVQVENQDVDIDYAGLVTEDLQMQEAVDILKDMIFIEAENKKAMGL